MTAQPRFFITGDGIRLAYQFDGDPRLPLLLLSNSIGTDLHMWDEQLALLTQAFYVLRYDARGHGASDAPPGAYSMDRLGRDVVELLDTLQLEKVHFLGLSLGGFVGQWLAIHTPQRIDRLVLSNTAAYLGPPAVFDAAIRQVLEAPDVHETAETFMHNWFPAALLANPSAQIQRFRSTLQTTSAHGLAGSWAAVRDADLRRTAQLITTPTLVIAGEHDTVTSARHGEELAAAIPGAAFTLMPTVHLSNVEQPEQFVAHVAAFLQAHA